MRSSQQRRDDAWDGMVSDLRLQWRSSVDVARAEGRDRQRAITEGRVPNRARYGDLPHLLLTIITGGLWGPVWLFVWWRNERRVDRIAMGSAGKQRRRAAKAKLKADQRAARKSIRQRHASRHSSASR